MGFGEFETPLKELEIKCNFFTVAELKLAGWILRQADSNPAVLMVKIQISISSLFVNWNFQIAYFDYNLNLQHF